MVTPSRPFSRLASTVAIATILVSVGIIYVLLAKPSIPDYPFGCDPYGYARQQELFRDKGFVNGLDTRAQDEEVLFLIKTARAAGLTPDQFGEMIAPHCHHYEEGSDSVILQYPPGTGFLLSLLPEDREVEALALLSLAVVLAVFGIFAVRSLPAFVSTAAVIGGLVVVAMPLANSTLMVSASFAPTLGFITLATALLLYGTHRPDRPSWWTGALLGLLAAFLMNLRIANAFVVIGMAVFIVIAIGSLSPKRLARQLPFLLSGVVVFAIGLLPLLTANKINAGGIFESTYGVADSAPARFETALFLRNLRFYFFDTPATPVTWGALAALLLVLVAAVFAPSPQSRRRCWAAFLGGAAAYGISIVFFGTHEIAATPYLIPTSAFCVGLCVFVVAETTGVEGLRLRAAGAVVTVVAVLAAGQVLMLPRHSYRVEAPAEVLAPEAIVWADMTSGTLRYYRQKYAAKVIFTGECEQSTLINAVSEAGRPQFFVVDSDAMQRLVDRIVGDGRLSAAGTLHAREDRPIFRLEPGIAVPGC
ncbi:hypothetical protein [Amorphus sp. 3PC139-8]|uniref:hypothetical protein n=1 Tax=Amorphus sp. 3PC139-8 TaxID=2735676 RepID=UPI00345CE7D2